MTLLSWLTAVASKAQVRAPAYRAELHEINKKEMKIVQERIHSQEHKDTITRFQAKRAAAKAKAAAKL